MHRTQILLEDEQYQSRKRESLVTGKSLSEIIRGCVRGHIRSSRQDPLLDLVGSIKAVDDPAPADLGERHDHYLYADK